MPIDKPEFTDLRVVSEEEVWLAGAETEAAVVVEVEGFCVLTMCVAAAAVLEVLGLGKLEEDCGRPEYVARRLLGNLNEQRMNPDCGTPTQTVLGGQQTELPLAFPQTVDPANPQSEELGG